VIYFLALREYLDTITAFLEMTGGMLGSRVRPLAYERVLGRMTVDFWWRRAKEAYWVLANASRRRSRHDWCRALGPLAERLLRCAWARHGFPRGTYVFADLERLSHDATLRAAPLWDTLAGSHQGVRLLNHPIHSMRRYELLRTLHERGINTFDVYRVTEGRAPRRYPVFLRIENDHGGPISPLVQSRSELEAAIRAFERKDHRREHLLVVEFCDTADPGGIFRKYGAFIVGDRIIPKSVQFSRHWVQKAADLKTPDLVREEAEYVERNPHEASLREIFRLARIEYGRMDYALLGDRLQVWEINTNPTIATPGSEMGPRAAAKRLVRERMVAAFEALADARHAPASSSVVPHSR
jgi:hypothetical protein